MHVSFPIFLLILVKFESFTKRIMRMIYLKEKFELEVSFGKSCRYNFFTTTSQGECREFIMRFT